MDMFYYGLICGCLIGATIVIWIILIYIILDWSK